jgi:predicted RecA/RadA family phage recombinase
MATNIYESNAMQVVQHTATATISSGDIVVMGTLGDAMLGVALVDIAIGDTGSVGYNCGVTAAKVSAAVFAKGETLTWDSSASAFDDNQAVAASGDVKGVAARADAAGVGATTTTKVWLTGIPAAKTA